MGCVPCLESSTIFFPLKKFKRTAIFRIFKAKRRGMAKHPRGRSARPKLWTCWLTPRARPPANKKLWRLSPARRHSARCHRRSACSRPRNRDGWRGLSKCFPRRSHPRAPTRKQNCGDLPTHADITQKVIVGAHVVALAIGVGED